MPENETLLTSEELAERLKVHPETIRRKTLEGVFRRGEHFIGGDGFPKRFMWNAVFASLGRKA